MRYYFSLASASSTGEETAEQVAEVTQDTVEQVGRLTQFLQDNIPQLIAFGVQVIFALIFFFVGRQLIKWVRKIVRHSFERSRADTGVAQFVDSLLKYGLYFLLIFSIAARFGVDTASVAALVASSGLTLGLALQGSLSNFEGGVLILLLKPFEVGDYIVEDTNHKEGTVKEIQLFNTVINTTDNKTIMIPNGGISTGIINNYSKESIRRVEWTFGIGYGDDYDLAKATIASMLDQDARVLKDPAYFIAVSSLGDSSVNIVVRAWTSTGDFWSVFFDMNEKVYKQFPIVGLNIPYPQMDVHIHQEGH